MERKIVVILELLAIMIALIVYSIVVVIPEYKNKIGSSDSFVQSSHYRNMIEVKIDSQTDFAFLINEEGKVYHLFFFDNSSVFLYNKNIENNHLEDSLKESVRLLIQYDCLRSSSKVEIVRYSDEFYDVFKKAWKKETSSFSLPKSILETKYSLEEKALDMGMANSSTSEILLNMDFYSKEIVKNSNVSV